MPEGKISYKEVVAALETIPALGSTLRTFPEDFIERVVVLAGENRCLSFLLMLALAKAGNVKNIIETGTLRRVNSPDGQSTRIFAEYVRLFGGKFYSVDISPDAINISKSEVGPDLLPFVNYVCQDSVSWLSRFQEPIELLYLDSYDFDSRNPGPAQRHEMAELGAAYGKLSKPAVVALDDCNIEAGGKGLLGTEFLKEREWMMLFDGYQRVFVNF